MEGSVSLSITLLCSLIAVATTSAQLLITSGSQSTTINFQSNLGWDGPTSDPTAGDDVFKWKNGPMTDPQNYSRNAHERDSWGWGGSNDYGPSAEAWSWRASGIDLGAGVGERTFFGDYNNNGSLGDGLNVIPGVDFEDMATLGIGDARDYAYAIGRNGGNNSPWRDFDLTLRVKNGSGATIDSWNVSLDTWYADPDSGNTNVTLAYSTDNVNFTPIDSYTTTNNGGVPTQSNLSGTISAAIADGAYLYIQVSNLRPSGGSGAGIVIDNWTVSAANGGAPASGDKVFYKVEVN